MYSTNVTSDVEEPIKPKKSALGTRPFFLFLAVVFILGFAAAIVTVLLVGGDNNGDDEDPLLDKYTYDNAAVAADHITCSEIGR